MAFHLWFRNVEESKRYPRWPSANPGAVGIDRLRAKVTSLGISQTDCVASASVRFTLKIGPKSRNRSSLETNVRNFELRLHSTATPMTSSGGLTMTTSRRVFGGINRASIFPSTFYESTEVLETNNTYYSPLSIFWCVFFFQMWPFLAGKDDQNSFQARIGPFGRCDQLIGSLPTNGRLWVTVNRRGFFLGVCVCKKWLSRTAVPSGVVLNVCRFLQFLIGHSEGSQTANRVPTRFPDWLLTLPRPIRSRLFFHLCFRPHKVHSTCTQWNAMEFNPTQPNEVQNNTIQFKTSRYTNHLHQTQKNLIGFSIVL